MVRLKLQIGTHHEVFEFGVSALGKLDIYLGHDWLRYHNPTIDWQKGSLFMKNCPGTCNVPEEDNGGEDVEGDSDGGVGGWHEWDEGDRLLAVMREEEEERWGI